MSVTGCEYIPMRIGRSNCCITVNGSWWRPTMAVPNTRSDGARRTDTAITTVMAVATAETPRTSARRPDTGDYRGKDQNRRRDSPSADVAHVCRHSCMEREDLQREQPCRLGEPEDREPRDEAPPAGGERHSDPQREIQSDLEGRQERDRTLRIVERRDARM